MITEVIADRLIYLFGVQGALVAIYVMAGCVLGFFIGVCLGWYKEWIR